MSKPHESSRIHVVLAFLAVTLTVVVIPVPGCDRGAADAGNTVGVTALENGLAAVQPPVPVAVSTARTGTIASHYTATATLEVEKEAEILARINGVVEAIEIEEGDSVTDGQLLLRIDNDEYRFAHDKAKANAEHLEASFARLESMSRDLVSTEEYETARNALATARAEEELARLNVSYTRVLTPFTGSVVHRHVDVGQNVSAGTPLFTVADLDPLLACFHVPAKEFRDLRTEQPVVLVLDSTDEKLQGRVTLVSPVIDPGTGTIKVTVEIPVYPPNTRPGDFAEVRVVTQVRSDTTLIPRAAVFTDRGDAVTYVASGEIAERRVVETGFANDEDIEVLAGVEAGEKVVVKGQRSLKHGSRLKVLEDSAPSVSRDEPTQDAVGGPGA